MNFDKCALSEPALEPQWASAGPDAELPWSDPMHVQTVRAGIRVRYGPGADVGAYRRAMPVYPGRAGLMRGSARGPSRLARGASGERLRKSRRRLPNRRAGLAGQGGSPRACMRTIEEMHRSAGTMTEAMGHLRAAASHPFVSRVPCRRRRPRQPRSPLVASKMSYGPQLVPQSRPNQSALQAVV